MASGWSQFGGVLTDLLTGAGGALASNPNLVSQITSAAFSAQNPNAAAEDTALANAEALFTVNPALAMKQLEKVEGLIPNAYIGVTMGLSAIKVDTPPLMAVQAIEIARAALKKPAGS